MHALLSFSRLLARFVSAVGNLAAWLTIPLMIVIIYDVITRNIITWLERNHYIGGPTSDFLTIVSSTKLQETEWHLHGILLLMTFGMAYLKDAHVRIELVRDHLSTRFKLWVEFLGIPLALIPYCGLVMFFGFDFASRAFASGEVSAALTGLTHRWIIKSFIGIGFFVLFLGGLSIWLRSLVALFGPNDLRPEASAFVDPDGADGAEEQNA